MISKAITRSASTRGLRAPLHAAVPKGSFRSASRSEISSAARAAKKSKSPNRAAAAASPPRQRPIKNLRDSRHATPWHGGRFRRHHHVYVARAQSVVSALVACLAQMGRRALDFVLPPVVCAAAPLFPIRRACAPTAG